MTTLTIGYVHLMIFAALIVIFLVYSITNCFVSPLEANEQYGHLSPVKLWLFIDEGIFSLLDDLDDLDTFDDYNRPDNQRESREAAERRLALDKLDEKPFETVRLDTIDQIRDGFVRGNLNSFRSPSLYSMASPRPNSPQRTSPHSFGFP